MYVPETDTGSTLVNTLDRQADRSTVRLTTWRQWLSQEASLGGGGFGEASEAKSFIHTMEMRERSVKQSGACVLLGGQYAVLIGSMSVHNTTYVQHTYYMCCGVVWARDRS